MAVNKEAYLQLITELKSRNVGLVAVSKTKTVQDILELYELGQKDFGENYVQELLEKQKQLPDDIRWHFIGHLQRNKVKFLVPFIHLIHGVDNFRLLDEIDHQAKKAGHLVHCLLQVHIAVEATKFGFSPEESVQLSETIQKYRQMKKYENIRIRGLMGMSSFSENEDLIRSEFGKLTLLFNDMNAKLSDLKMDTLSMGMSNDYKIAVEEGSTLVRIGSMLFGARV